MAARVPQGFENVVKGAAFAVADGISSSQVSQIAAETAAKALITDYYATPQTWTVKTSAAHVIRATNSWLFAQNRYQRTSDMNLGMVCTLSALILKAQEAHIFHVGDSRIARLSGSNLEPLTNDHTAVYYEHTQYLGRAVGAAQRIDIDYQVVPLTVGDVFLLTTDGVHEFIDVPSIRHSLNSTPDLNQAASEIVAIALERGSPDNLTIQIVRIEELARANTLPNLIENRLPTLATFNPGETLDNYRVIREVHHSPRSQLSLATSSSGERVALKIPTTETLENPDALQRFLFEEWIARRVRSPHIVKAASTDTERSASYVAMHWIDGCTLRQWLIDHPQPHIDDVRSIAEQIIRGLRALHRQEMIHQDLRPENIMLDRAGTAIIVDLGSVAVAGLEQAAPGSLGRLPGTLQYTAPEYLSGADVNWRSDQFALGVIVYEMLTGRLPYGTKVAQVRNRRDQQRLTYQPADLDDSCVPSWVNFALSRACHRDPHRRYDALSEFMADLKTPSKDYRPEASRPLLERNPQRFWQGLVALQLLVIVFLIALV